MPIPRAPATASAHWAVAVTATEAWARAQALTTVAVTVNYATAVKPVTGTGASVSEVSRA